MRQLGSWRELGLTESCSEDEMETKRAAGTGENLGVMLVLEMELWTGKELGWRLP